MKVLLGLYALLGRLGTPLLAAWLAVRCRQGKEDPTRRRERWGHARLARPPGPLVWIHAASLGESLAVLPVVERLTRGPDALHVLLTTVTRSSGELMAERLPPRAIHAYAPLDTAPAMTRFLAHWQPAATVVVEQELWPLLLARSPAPRLLVNARLSARSARRWQRWRPIARWLLGRFALILAQSRGDGERLRALGAAHVEMPGNLKTAAPPLPVDAAELAQLRDAIGERPVWVAASTHEPEEAWVEAADRVLRARFPDLLTIIVPRHPARAEAISTRLARADLGRRTTMPVPERATGIYLVDGFGELGLIYRVAMVAFVGGSLLPHGGQNPLEAARLGCPVVFGPHMTNFRELADALVDEGAARRVEPATLADAVADWLGDDGRRARAADAGARLARALGDAALTRTTNAIRDAVERR